MIRCYLNTLEEGQRPWDIDLGPNTDQVSVDSVHISVIMRSVVDRSVATINQPKAWFQSDDVATLSITQENGKVLAFIR